MTGNTKTAGSHRAAQASAAASDAEASAEPKLRVGVLAACPFPANHGTPGSIREMAEAVGERGHEVHVVTYHFGEDIPLRNVHLHRIRPLTRESKVFVGPTALRPLYDLQMVFEAIRVVREHRIDVLHAHNYEGGLVAALCRLFTGCPYIYSAHNTMGDELASYDFFRFKWMARALAALLDATVPRMGNRCIPHSENLRKFLESKNLAERCEPVLNFGIDLDEPPPADADKLREEYQLGEGPVILYAGVMDHFQRLDLLLEAMVRVAWVEPQAKLVLVTTVPNDEHQRAIRQKIRELKLEEQVIITEPQELADVKRFLQVCDVAVVPRPHAPGFPIKLLNYMACRRACVMFASSASRLTHGEHVWLAQPDTSEALADGILELLRDESLRAQLAAGGYRFVSEHHDRRLTAQRLCEAYVRLLQSTRRWPEISRRAAIQVPSRRAAQASDVSPQPVAAPRDRHHSQEVAADVIR